MQETYKEYIPLHPKKKLAQHFLKDTTIAQKIVKNLTAQDCQTVIEIGPGTGALTKWLVKHTSLPLYLIEVDASLATQLQQTYPTIKDRIINADFLKFPLKNIHSGPVALIGNFPYNISSAIFFKILEQHDHIKEVVCMLQKEVADRICARAGNKTYGLLSVLLQTFYTISYCFIVPPSVFKPAPKVYSAVIHLKRHTIHLPCKQAFFFTVVKAAFSKRRKMLRNALASLHIPLASIPPHILTQRAEELTPQAFIWLTQLLSSNKADKN